jgi:hypothetical protein
MFRYYCYFFCGYVLSLSLINSAEAQVPNAVKEKILQAATVEYDGKIYALVKGTIRGTRETAEEKLATKAMSIISHKLCGLVPVAGHRLQAQISGFSRASSELIGSDLSVIMSAPSQTPLCEMILLPASDLTKTALNKEGPNATQQSKENLPLVKNAVPSSPSSKGIIIRNYGNEY